MNITLHRRNLKLKLEVQMMSELENSILQHINFKSDNIDTIHVFYDELITSDSITIDNQITTKINKIEIEKYETFAVLRVDIA